MNASGDILVIVVLGLTEAEQVEDELAAELLMPPEQVAAAYGRTEWAAWASGFQFAWFLPPLRHCDSPWSRAARALALCSVSLRSHPPAPQDLADDRLRDAASG